MKQKFARNFCLSELCRTFSTHTHVLSLSRTNNVHMLVLVFAVGLGGATWAKHTWHEQHCVDNANARYPKK